MVLFFSATGNTEFIARQIALKLGDECLNLLGRVRQGVQMLVNLLDLRTILVNLR